jgi:dTDP-4-dehydro-6-deoxy-alpha-D-glucopyranose 2,3-dehydratase
MAIHSGIKSSLVGLSFLKSAFTESNPFISTGSVIEWMKRQNEQTRAQIRKIPFRDMTFWNYDEKEESIKHASNKFFSIVGINVKTNWPYLNTTEWEQPIICQPEVGFLGLIAKEFDGVLCFLMQAKIEPGNVNFVQLSPTLQATRSNFSQVHHGKKPLFLEYFRNATSGQILLDQLQSEQGARFLQKRNRNIIIRLEEDLDVPNNFIWLTLGQIKKLMQLDNLVNMDTRTVISGIPYGSFDPDVIKFFASPDHNREADPLKVKFLSSALTNDGAYHTIEEIITFITKLKSESDLEIRRIPLKTLKDWIFDEESIYHKDKKFFKVIATEVEIGSREVIKWSQPMVEPAQDGLYAFVCKEINGLMHFIVQAKLECGNHDIIEFAPTVQCLTGNYRQTREGTLPFLEYVLNAGQGQIFYDSRQSEEGGRFFHEQNRNMIVIDDKDEIPVELPQNYIWMTLNQLYTFLKFNNYLNIQSRSLIAAISFI